MKNIKVSEATPDQLDWLVMGLLFGQYAEQGDPIKAWVKERYDAGDPCGNPTADWLEGGPIIEREGINVSIQHDEHGRKVSPTHRWYAQLDCRVYTAYGPTPLIAAMRCFVSSKMGDVVEVPEELG